MAPPRRDYGGGAAVAAKITTDLNASVTSIPIDTATGWPTGSVGPFYVVIDPGKSNEEKVLVLSRSTLTLQVVTTPSTGRGGDGTTAVSHSTGAEIKPVLTATEVRELNEHMVGVETDPHSTTLLNNARHDVTARHTAGTVVPTGAPSSTSVATDTAAEGTASTVARSDHRHPREGFGAPVASAVGDAASNGAATTLARSDHKHAREAFGPVVAETTAGQASANGTATTVARSDHTHGTPPSGTTSFGSPGASAPGDSANDGVSSSASRADHRHSRESFGASGDISTLVYGASAAAGSSPKVARADHAHAQSTPRCRIRRAANQTIATATATPIQFVDSDRYDTDNMHSTSANNGQRIVFNTAGTYHVGASLEFTSNTSGSRTIDLLINGISIITGNSTDAPTGICLLSVSTDWDFAAGDYVEIRVTQTSGGNLDVVGGTAAGHPRTAEAWAHRVG